MEQHWFEEWERTHNVDNDPAFWEKVSENTLCLRPKPSYPVANSIRPCARARNNRYNALRTKRFHEHMHPKVSSCSLSLPHYYLPDASKPTHICRIYGKHSFYIWAGPSYNKFLRSTVNRRIRRLPLSSELPSKGRYLMHMCAPQEFD